MPVKPSSDAKAQTARRNGAKSHGPTTEAGKEKCRQAAAARRRAGTILPGESDSALRLMIEDELAHWQPKTPTARQMVHELADLNWRVKRLRYAQTHALAAEVAANEVTAEEAELTGVATQHALDRRVAVLTVVRSRILRDLERLARRFEKQTGSNPERKTQDLPAQNDVRVPTPEPEDILPWAKANLGFVPDPPQTVLLTTESKDVLLLGARQTGKSTAAAVRAVYEAVHYPESTILLAGPSGRQSGQILDKVRKMIEILGLPTSAAPPRCDGFTLPNGSEIISLPDNPDKIRAFSAPRLIVVDDAAFVSDELFGTLTPMLAVSGGRMFLLSTPSGQYGYFHDKWHEKNSSYRKIVSTAADCPRIRPETLELFRQRMSREQFAQEFECEFTPPVEQFASYEHYRNAIQDLKPLFEEDEEDGE